MLIHTQKLARSFILYLLVVFLLIFNVIVTITVHAQECEIIMKESLPFSLDEIVHATSGMTVRQPEYCNAQDGIKLALYKFVPENSKKIIIFYHGAGSWSGKSYQFMANALCDNYNTGCYLVDVRGHGNSGGSRGDAPSQETVWTDIDTVIKYIRAQHPTAQLFLAGHSAGGGLVLNYTQWQDAQERDQISGYLLFAPYLGPRALSNREIADTNKRFVKKVNVFKLILNGISGGWLFEHDPVIYFNYPVWLKQSDSLVIWSYTCAMAKATSVQDPEKVFIALDKPLAVFVGSNDEQFLPKALIDYAKLCTHPKLMTEILPEVKHISILLHAAQASARALVFFERERKES